MILIFRGTDEDAFDMFFQHRMFFRVGAKIFVFLIMIRHNAVNRMTAPLMPIYAYTR